MTASFLTEDSYLGNIREPLTLNRYNYCISSYLNYEDPSGNIIGFILVTCAVIGGVIGLVSGVVSEVQRYDQVEEYNWTDGVCNVLTDVVSGALGGTAIATTGNPVAAGWVSGTTHGLLDGVRHIDTGKSVEENLYDIMYSSARDGLTGTLWGVGWRITGSLTQGMYLSPSVNIFLQGAGGGALSSTVDRYLSGGTVTAETVVDDAYTGGLQALAFNRIGRAVQRMVMPEQKLPKGYLRDRANSVTELDASKQCEGKSEPNGVGNPVRVEGRGNTGRTTPNTLLEQMAMNQVRSNPLEGATKVPLTMSDKRWPASEGWVKMQSVVENSYGTKTIIHFVYNEITGAFDDFKFKQ